MTSDRPYNTEDLAKYARLQSTHMVHYLRREGILKPERRPGRSGKGVELFFNHQDVVFARAIAKLLAAGASVKKLKVALRMLRQMMRDVDDSALIGQHVVIAGAGVYFEDLETAGKVIVDLAAEGQLAFHFVLDAPPDRPNKRDNVIRRRA